LVSTLSQTSNILRAEEEYLQSVSEKSFKKCLILKEKGLVVFDCLKLQSYPLAIQLRCLRDGIASFKGNLRQITYKHLFSIVQLLSKAGSSKCLNLPGGIKITKEYDRLTIQGGQKGTPSFFYTFSLIPEFIHIKDIKRGMRFTLMKGEKPFSFTSGQDTAYLDSHKVRFPLIIRNYFPGDWFYPSGMRGRKKIKDFFSDKKIPVSERKRIPLLLFGNRISWVGGFRVDQEMAATLETMEILKVELRSL
jgi:tRNA(Ile)-lysidine synthase